MSRENSQQPFKGEDDELTEGKYYIRNPNDLSKRIECKTMKEVMHFWKGFNTPYMKGDSFVQSETRLKKYMQKLYDEL